MLRVVHGLPHFNLLLLVLLSTMVVEPSSFITHTQVQKRNAEYVIHLLNRLLRSVIMGFRGGKQQQQEQQRRKRGLGVTALISQPLPQNKHHRHDCKKNAAQNYNTFMHSANTLGTASRTMDYICRKCTLHTVSEKRQNIRYCSPNTFFITFVVLCLGRHDLQRT